MNINPNIRLLDNNNTKGDIQYSAKIINQNNSINQNITFSLHNHSQPINKINT